MVPGKATERAGKEGRQQHQRILWDSHILGQFPFYLCKANVSYSPHVSQKGAPVPPEGLVTTEMAGERKSSISNDI